MNLVRFLLLGSILSLALGEFGRYPFGASGGSVTVTDVLLSLCLLFFTIWKIINHQRVKLPAIFKWQGLFWLIGATSLAVSLFIYPWLQTTTGWLYLLRYILYSSSLVIAYDLTQQIPTFKQQFINASQILGILLIITGMLQLILFPNFDFLTQYGFDPHQGRLTATILDPNFAGTILVFIFGLNLSDWRKQKTRVLLSGLLIAILLTFSRTAYLMLAILLIYYALSHSIKLFIGLIVVGLVLVLAIPRVGQRLTGALSVDQSAAARLESWQNGLKIFEQHPLLGVGFNNYRLAQSQDNLFQTYSAEGGHAGSGSDSSLIFVLATTGVIGVLSYLWYWFQLGRKLLLSKQELTKLSFGLLLALFISSQFINALFFPALMLLYFVLTAVVYEN